MKHIIANFIHEHKDLLQISGVGATGFGAMLTNIELVLKILIASATLGYILWKWRRDYKKK